MDFWYRSPIDTSIGIIISNEFSLQSSIAPSLITVNVIQGGVKLIRTLNFVKLFQFNCSKIFWKIEATRFTLQPGAGQLSQDLWGNLNIANKSMDPRKSFKR